MGNLIVADSEYQDLSSLYSDAGTKAEEQLDKYLSIMAAVCNDAISDGYTHANLLLFVEEASQLIGLISGLTWTASKDFSTYIDSIDEADQYLY